MTAARTTVGVLHPGAMGVTVAATCAANSAAEVVWCSAGRPIASVDRATSAGLAAVDTLDELVGRSEVIVSVCPPGAALDVADEVAAIGFDGFYVDARGSKWRYSTSGRSPNRARPSDRRRPPG